MGSVLTPTNLENTGEKKKKPTKHFVKQLLSVVISLRTISDCCSYNLAF